MEFSLFTDGGARGNPGPAAWAFVLYDAQTIVAEQSGYLGTTTNNVAEYSACLEGLRYIAKQFGGGNIITCYADSELLVEQMSGRYKIKSPHLKVLVGKMRELVELQKKVTYQHIVREHNKEADRLVNRELDNST
ncbi:MAG: hypothetical protein A2V81_00310 [Candidatus Abawacabacteria bacterium RBG_16_42_10]|uniref:RNase H type-1 domain-containing protein n=1 Tax=Candidatus Abawacabacteria bacterium RBG_16_42_10 TaxID=1817814 RepID=A0A1F4XLF2_9BACT|nr:MAG: hypothetical protein A2V81_00310 [Candidatus Abawacabacteria bacterium RBG_16_42_10]